ncbi:sterigmatocystin 8-O-methyltransferase precursor [Lindgomyces ingoldianus]|uniref:Sterigmatocystin 8-O-methyltransferase n=1 Tax=Lindgomyces ingoldianus TaxID=673940 RepID=A0ACB6R2L4_9PLEO|nr:sterigmatocystin 8-O-methyltransferase precursor [Lindgomyces ingoldianus]KAF2473020.1 sterigmatocystin 8-O-methyltransferase precursor [Lindgomyces ingoldianus]
MVSADSHSNLLKLVSKIKHHAEDIENQLRLSGRPEPSFEKTSIEVPDTPEYTAARASLNDAANDLLLLVNGPKAHFRSLFCYHHDLAAFQVAFELDFFNNVPFSGVVTIPQLAEAVKVDEDRVGRIMRFLTTHRVFTETEPGFFGHNSFSVLFAKDSEIYAAAHYQLDEFFKAASEASEGIRSSPYLSDNMHSPFQTRFGVPLFQYYQQNPKSVARFGKALKGIAKLDRQVHELKGGFPWEKFEGGKIVDIGGASGHASIWLARLYPQLEFIVQDGSEDLLAQGKGQNLSDIGSRVTFMKHDFFQTQPQLNAGAYFIRQVLHNWNDDDCVRILKAVVPALEKCNPNTPLLINETILPEPGTLSRYEEHSLRQVDMLVMVALGAKQRTQAEFQDLLHQADPCLEIVRVYGTGSMGLLEVQMIKDSDATKGG